MIGMSHAERLFEAAKEPKSFKLISELEVSARPTWAHVAVCGNEVLIRDLKGLSSYRWE